MRRVEVKRQLGRGDIAAVSALLEKASHHDGHHALGEHQWLDLVHGGAAGFAGLVAREAGRDQPVGYAQVTRGDHFWAVEYVVDPDRRDDPEIATDLLAEAWAVVTEGGGGHLHLWRSHPTDATDASAAAVGMRRGRDLLQLRRRLPLDEPWSLEARAFVPGQDEQAWLELNNRAFRWHPEQGGWDDTTLKSREAEAWFDPRGLLLHERAGRLAGFCWTKVHAAHDPPLGEIYVVAVDPDLAGQGLGRQLVLAGLDHLSGKGLSVAMLYCDADNAVARALYDHLGFTLNHIDRAYTADVPPPDAGTSPADPPTPTG